MSELDSLLEREGITGADDSAPVSPSPAKKRGRPKGTSKKAMIPPPVERDSKMDRKIVIGFTEAVFAIVTNIGGERFRPLPEEPQWIGGNLASVLEKRLPSEAAENLPEIALAIGVLAYVGRVYFSGTANGQSDSNLRETWVGENGLSEKPIVERTEGASV